MKRGPGPAFAKVMDDQHAGSAPEAYFRVAIWMMAQTQPIKAKRMAEHFGVHRSTAHRWLNDWRSATGVAA